MSVDALIRGAIVHDDTGAPGCRADAAVADGRIVAVGEGLERDRGRTGYGRGRAGRVLRRPQPRRGSAT